MKVKLESIPKGWDITQPQSVYNFDDFTALIVLSSKDGFRAWNILLAAFSSPLYDDEGLIRMALNLGSIYVDQYELCEGK